MAANDRDVAQFTSKPSDAVKKRLQHLRTAQQILERLAQTVLGAPPNKAGFTSGRKEAKVLMQHALVEAVQSVTSTPAVIPCYLSLVSCGRPSGIRGAKLICMRLQ